MTAPVEHPSERKTRLEEQVEEGKLRRWKEKTFIRSFITFASLICVVWVIVVLSGIFPPAVEQSANELVKGLLWWMGGMVAGKGVDKWIGS